MKPNTVPRQGLASQRLCSSLHAKFFLFETDNHSYCLIGSANATIAALGSLTSKAINDEFCILYRSSKRNFLVELGLGGKHVLKSDVSQMQRKENEPTVTMQNTFQRVSILSIDLQDDKLYVYLSNNSLTGNMILIGSSRAGEFKIGEIDIKQSPIVIDILSNYELLYCYIVDENGIIISNKQYVNRIKDLDSTNPSPRNRYLNKMLSGIENGDYDGLEILSFVNDIISDLYNITENRIRSKGNSDYVAKRNTSYREELYEDWQESDDENKSYTYANLSVSKLLECIEQTIKEKVRIINEELSGEEDEGNPEESNNREYANKSKLIPVQEDKLDRTLDEIENFIIHFLDYINLRMQQYGEDKGKGLNENDLKLYSVSVYTVFELCYLDKNKYDFSDSSDPDDDRDYFEDHLEEIMNRLLSVVINNFTAFVIKSAPSVVDGLQHAAHSAIHYTIMVTDILIRQYGVSVPRQMIDDMKLCIKNMTVVFGVIDINIFMVKINNITISSNVNLNGNRMVELYHQCLAIDENSDEYKFFKGYGICRINKKGNTIPIQFKVY